MSSELLSDQENQQLYALIDKALGLEIGNFYEDNLGTLLYIALGMATDDEFLEKAEALADEIEADDAEGEEEETEGGEAPATLH